MPAIEFTQNYDDLSTDHGFQFRFHCDRCNNGYMSTFKPNQFGVAGEFIRGAGQIFGGMFSGVGNAAYNIQQAIGGPQHDAALQEAVQEIKPKFEQCHRCGTWVCGEICWNKGRGMCKECAPVLEEELASTQAQVAREQLLERAQGVDQTHGVAVDGTALIRCPSCGADAGTGKFCAECGAPLGAPKCAKCHAELTKGAKFCGECGTPCAH